MATVALTGNDTLVLGAPGAGHVFNDLADGSVIELEFPNDISTVKTGKNGNSIYGQNQTGQQATVKLRVIRASSDDKFLNSLLAGQGANFAGFPLLIGEFTKNVGTGGGDIAADKYLLSGGVFKKNVPGKSNVDGDTEQSIAMYELQFAKAVRVIT